MLRSLVVFCALACIQDEASAALSRKDAAPRPDERRDTLHAAGRAPEPVGGNLTVTESTEVLLDGQACKFADVPAKATIIQLELTPDKKTIHRIHFRSGK
jgi:hypothetical protein